MRATIPKEGERPWMRRLEELRLKRFGLSPHYRSRDAIEVMIRATGLGIEDVEAAAPGSEEVWFVAERRQSGGAEP